MFMQMAARRRRMGGFSPLTLFAAGEQGAWLAPSDLSTLFQDDAGATPVTAAGQSVGMVLDKSKGLVLGPELVVNGDFSSGATGWSLSDAAVTDGTLVVTNGGRFAAQALVVEAGKSYRISFTHDTTSGANLRLNTQAANGAEALVRWATSGGTSGILTGVFTATSTFIALEADGATYSGTIDNVSVRELPGNHATQAVFAARPIYRVSSGIPHIEDDLVDDSLNWTAPAGNYTVAWCDTAGNVTIQTAQALSGATDALRTQRMVGYLAINRALTAAETVSLTAWLKAKAGV